MPKSKPLIDATTKPATKPVSPAHAAEMKRRSDNQLKANQAAKASAEKHKAEMARRALNERKAKAGY